MVRFLSFQTLAFFRPVGSCFGINHMSSSIIRQSSDESLMSLAVRVNQVPTVTVALLMLTISAIGFISFEENTSQRDELPAEEVARFVNSPGHPVFSQYITSDNCGFCYAYGSPAHHSIKSQHPDDYVYISYQSVSYGDTDTARAGNTAGYDWPWTTSGAPDSYWGDRLDKRVSGCGSNTCYDSMFASGGGMSAATTSQYSLKASISESASNFDVNIEAKYIGSGSAPSGIYLYAALTEETCYSYPYADGSRGHNCWKSWLMDSGDYRSQSGGTGNGFQSVSLTSSNPMTYTWSIPSALVSGGYSNALVVAALMTGAPSTGSGSEHVLTATDSNMGPLIDVGITDFQVNNLNGHNGFVSGDQLELVVDIANNGEGAYGDGGDIDIYHLDQGSEVHLGGTKINSLSIGGTQTYSTIFDTSDITLNPSGSSTFRARLSDLTADRRPDNNLEEDLAFHDMPPVPNRPVVVAASSVERGEEIQFESSALANDLVDDMSSMSGELHYSLHGDNSWANSWVTEVEMIGSGGNSRYIHTIQPPLQAPSGLYDVRMQWADASGQTSDWVVTENAFELRNALPRILQPGDQGYYGIPTVKVDTVETVSIVGLVSDAETPHSELLIDSNAPQFISYNSDTQEINIKFDEIFYDSHGNAASQGIFVTIGDGEDFNSGTLLFNVIENGQPRWSGVPTQGFDEGGSASLILTEFLSDTDDNGNSVPANTLDLSIVSISDESLITATIFDQTLNVAAVNDDNFGLAEIVVRASDGVKESDTVITFYINNINDAPVIDVGDFSNEILQTGDRITIDVISLVTDVDDPADEIWITVTSFVPGAVVYNPISGMATMSWEDSGEEIVTITAEDRHGASTAEIITINVVDDLPLTWADSAGNGDLLVNIDTKDFGTNPSITIDNVNSMELSDIEVIWNVCNSITGICNDYGKYYDLGPFIVLANGGDGLGIGDYLTLSVNAVDENGFDRATQDQFKAYATEPIDPVEEEPSDDNSDKANSLSLTTAGFMITGLMLSIALVLALGIVLQRQIRRSPSVEIIDYSDQADYSAHQEPISSPQIVPPLPPNFGPPLPPEGLPPGWTMEQWNYYGEEYLRRREMQ